MAENNIDGLRGSSEIGKNYRGRSQSERKNECLSESI